MLQCFLENAFNCAPIFARGEEKDHGYQFASTLVQSALTDGWQAPLKLHSRESKSEIHDKQLGKRRETDSDWKELMAVNSCSLKNSHLVDLANVKVKSSVDFNNLFLRCGDVVLHPTASECSAVYLYINLTTDAFCDVSPRRCRLCELNSSKGSRRRRALYITTRQPEKILTKWSCNKPPVARLPTRRVIYNNCKTTESFSAGI